MRIIRLKTHAAVALTEAEELLLARMRTNCKSMPFHPIGDDVKVATALKRKGLLVSGGTWPNAEGFELGCQIAERN